jgi:hypothetical protein
VGRNASGDGEGGRWVEGVGPFTAVHDGSHTRMVWSRRIRFSKLGVHGAIRMTGLGSGGVPRQAVAWGPQAVESAPVEWQGLPRTVIRATLRP